MSDPYDIVRVELDSRAYDVHITSGLLERGDLIASVAKSRRAFVVTDAHVNALHGRRLMQALMRAGLSPHLLELEPGEGQKSFAGLERVTRWLIGQGVDRHDIVIAFGGGVIGDLVGFSAGVVKRGVDFVQIPTTLLAQVDSSVGGKTAIDTPEGKNLVGLFYQPRLVLADLDVLRTLPARELRAGYAEVVKYGLLGDRAFFDWLEANAPAILACDHDALAHAVTRSVAAKAAIVAADELEGGQSALLNIGHTFAHALEVEAGFDGALLHGEAVAAGMALAFALSARLGLCDTQDAVRVARHLRQAGFELDLKRLPGGPYNAERLMAAMAHDKKNVDGKLTLILARGIGEAFVQKGASAGETHALLTEALA